MALQYQPMFTANGAWNPQFGERVAQPVNQQATPQAVQQPVAVPMDQRKPGVIYSPEGYEVQRPAITTGTTPANYGYERLGGQAQQVQTQLGTSAAGAAGNGPQGVLAGVYVPPGTPAPTTSAAGATGRGPQQPVATTTPATTAPVQPTGPLLSPLESALLTQQQQWLTQQAQAQQQAGAQRTAQQTAGLSPEAAAGIQQQVQAQGAQTLMEQLRSASNTIYGSAMDRASAQETEARERMYSLLEANAGNPELLKATLDAALLQMPNDPFLLAIKANPELLTTLTDTARAESETQAIDLANQYLIQNIDATGDNTPLFDQWYQRRFGADDVGTQAVAQTWVMSWTPEKQEILADYEEKFGPGLDLNDPADVARLYGYSQFLRAVNDAGAADLVDRVDVELRNAGMELTPELRESALKVAGDLETIFQGDPVTIAGITGEWTADVENGPFSVRFYGWDGEELQPGYVQTEADKKLDALWIAAWKANPEAMDGMTRDEFYDKAVEAGVPTMGTMADPDAVLETMGIGGAGTMTAEQEIEKMNDNNWWRENSAGLLSIPGGQTPNDNDWDSASQVVKAYERRGWKPGAYVDYDNGRYRIVKVYAKLITEDDNHFRGYMEAYDQAGNLVKIPLGKHYTF